MSLKYLRFVSDEELAEFHANRRLLPSRTSWPPYVPADEVVFLYYEDRASATDLLAYADQHVQSRGRLHLLRVTFTPFSIWRVEPDHSNVVRDVTYVHRGAIVESDHVRIAYLALFTNERTSRLML